MAQKTLGNVSYTRDEVARMLFLYNVVRDCIEGEPAIKGIIRSSGLVNNGMSGMAASVPVTYDRSAQSNLAINLLYAKRYLPQPNPEDTSKVNEARYRAYVERAVFYNVTGRTLDGMAGQVFQRDPIAEIPKELDGLNLDADGTGVGLNQLAMRAVRTVLPFGRAGLLTDYPPTTGATSKKQLEDGYIQPVIYLYEPWNVINWRTRKRGAKQILELVVLREYANTSDDEYEYKPGCQYRVLRLSADDIYSQEVFSESADNKDQFTSIEKVAVTDSKGKNLDYIPFTFIGAENNDTCVDMPPFYDIASLNIGHYRNSADYEESAYITGQPTIAVAGLTEDWVKNVLKGQVSFGSRGGLPLPSGATADILQADPNTLPGEAMEKKERQMVALGAKLVQQQTVQRTASEAIMETSSETSILANVATNVSTAFESALKIAAKFAGGDGTKIKFQLNRQFELAQLTPDDQAKIIAGWQKGAYTFGEMRSVLRKGGIVTLPDKEAQATIKDEISSLMDQGLIADANPDPVPPAGGAPNPNANPKAHALKKKTRGAGA